MTVGVTSAALACVVAITVTVAILFKRPRRSLYSTFASFTFALSFWHAATLASQLGGQRISTLQHIAAVLLPPTALFFFGELLRDRSRRWRRTAMASIPVSILFLGLAFTEWGSTWMVQAPTLIYVGATLLFVTRGMFNRVRHSSTEAEGKRWRLLFYGGSGAMVLAAGELIPNATVFAALGHVAVTLYVYFLYQSIVARRLIDLVELLGKGAVLGVLTLVLATVYSLLVWWVGENQQGLWLFNTLVASFVILILYDQVRPWVEKTTAKAMFRQRYDLELTVKRLERELRTTIQPAAMRSRTLDTLVDSGIARAAAIYLPSNDREQVYTLAGHRGDSPPPVLSAAAHPTLVNELRRELRPLLLEHLESRLRELPTLADEDPIAHRELQRLSEAVAQLGLFHASVMLPMVVGHHLVGVLTVGEPATSAPYSTREIAGLMRVAEACAVVIQNSHEYSQAQQRDRLAAIGEMATGMAHEIRNPLGAIKCAAQCLDPQARPEESRELLDVIIEEVDRLNSVVVQFLEYARPYRGNPEPTDLNDVVAATARLLERDANPHNVTLHTDLAHDLPRVSIDPEQLKQALLNLTLNAVQAMPQGGSVRISTAIAHEHHDDASGSALQSYVLVRVSDTGPGIPPEDLSRIFVPFFTTKERGTGLGLPITQRIVENAGGRMEVTSRAQEGTTFTLRFPSVDTRALEPVSPAPLFTEDSRTSEGDTVH